jgi:hypothetical protein
MRRLSAGEFVLKLLGLLLLTAAALYRWFVASVLVALTYSGCVTAAWATEGPDSGGILADIADCEQKSATRPDVRINIDPRQTPYRREVVPDSLWGGWRQHKYMVCLFHRGDINRKGAKP